MYKLTAQTFPRGKMDEMQSGTALSEKRNNLNED